MSDQIKAKTLPHGHGHVYPNADGTKARCGGPGLCSQCSREAAQKKSDDELSKEVVKEFQGHCYPKTQGCPRCHGIGPKHLIGCQYFRYEMSAETQEQMATANALKAAQAQREAAQKEAMRLELLLIEREVKEAKEAEAKKKAEKVTADFTQDQRDSQPGHQRHLGDEHNPHHPSKKTACLHASHQHPLLLAVPPVQPRQRPSRRPVSMPERSGRFRVIHAAGRDAWEAHRGTDAAVHGGPEPPWPQDRRHEIPVMNRILQTLRRLLRRRGRAVNVHDRREAAHL